MKFVLAIHIDAAHTRVAAVSFEAWDAPEPERSQVFMLPPPEGKKPARGAADLRALPALQQLLREQPALAAAELIVLYGWPVHLDAQETPGLGAHLQQALGGRGAVIGVLKSAPVPLPAQFELQREDEMPPLYLSCIGIDLGAARVRLRSMHGKRRVPTLLKLAARLARNGER